MGFRITRQGKLFNPINPRPLQEPNVNDGFFNLRFWHTIHLVWGQQECGQTGHVAQKISPLFAFPFCNGLLTGAKDSHRVSLRNPGRTSMWGRYAMFLNRVSSRQCSLQRQSFLSPLIF